MLSRLSSHYLSNSITVEISIMHTVRRRQILCNIKNMHYWIQDALYDKASGNSVDAQTYALPDFMHYVNCIMDIF